MCNTSKPCHNGAVCVNLKEEEGGYWCGCPQGYNGINCSIFSIEGMYREGGREGGRGGEGGGEYCSKMGGRGEYCFKTKRKTGE